MGVLWVHITMRQTLVVLFTSLLFVCVQCDESTTGSSLAQVVRSGLASDPVLAESYLNLSRQMPCCFVKGEKGGVAGRKEELLMATRFVNAAKQIGAIPTPFPRAPASNGPPAHNLLCASFLLFTPDVISVAIENIRLAGRHCTHWAFIFYGGDKLKIAAFKEQQGPKVVLAHSVLPPSRNTFVPKPLMYPALAPLLSDYKRVWLLDADISLKDFEMEKFLGHLDCLTPPPLVAQPVVVGSSQSFPVLNLDWWNDEATSKSPGGFKFDRERGPVTTFRWRYVEQQVPIFDASFFHAFLRGVVSPLSGAYRALGDTDWGLDDVWCAAAAAFAGGKDVLPCAVILATPVQHLGTRVRNASIHTKHSPAGSFGPWRFHFSGFAMRLLVRRSFPRYFLHSVDGRELRGETYKSFCTSKFPVYYKDQCTETP